MVHLQNIPDPPAYVKTLYILYSSQKKRPSMYDIYATLTPQTTPMLVNMSYIDALGYGYSNNGHEVERDRPG